MLLRDFRLQLQKIEKCLPGRISWPFLCHGSPLTCHIFIVGANPATQVKKKFWGFWTDSRGFRKTAFLQERVKLDGGLSTTRKNIEIVAAAAGQKVTLETNIYPYAAGRVSELTAEQKRTEVIEYLLHTVKPRIVLAHGSEAKKFFRQHCHDFIEDDTTPRTVTWDDRQQQFQLLCSHHLNFQGIRGTHVENAERIGQALADALH